MLGSLIPLAGLKMSPVTNNKEEVLARVENVLRVLRVAFERDLAGFGGFFLAAVRI